MTPESEYRLFIEPHMDKMRREIDFLVKNKSDRADILQDVRIRAFKNLGKYNPDNVQSWLITITKNLVRDYFRYNKNRWEKTLYLETICGHNHNTLYPDENPQDPKCLAAEDQKFKMIDYKEIIKDLNPLYQNVINLYVFDNLNESEVADTLGINLTTVKNHIFKGRKQFKQLLDNVAR